MRWEIAEDVLCTVGVEDEVKCEFCGSSVDVKAAVESDLAVKRYVHTIKELAEWRRSLNALYKEALKAKINLDEYLRRYALIHGSFNRHWVASYGGMASVKCKNCGETQAFHVSLNVGIEVEEAPKPDMLAQLKCPNEVLLKVARWYDYTKPEDFQRWLDENKENRVKLVGMVKEAIESGVI